MVDISWEALEPKYADLLDRVKVKPSWKLAANTAAKKIIANRVTYQEVSEVTGVPWEFIGLVHQLEGGGDFKTHLHNGNTLNRRTTDVPKGRPIADPENGEGEPYTWKESAIDALMMKGLNEVTEWTDERICFELERYNGFGYRKYHPSVLTPYIWSGTNLYKMGKYVKDGVWSASAVSKQTGCWPILESIREIIVTQEVKVAKSASRKITTIDRVRNVTGGTIASYFTLDWLGVAKDTMIELKSFMSENAAMLIFGTAVTYLIVNEFLKRWNIQDIKEGRTIPSGLAAKDAE